MQRSHPPEIDPRIAAAARGDRQAAHTLLRELLPRVRNLIRYLSRSDQEIDDIAQQVLIEMAHSFTSYRGEGSLAAWADRITVRVSMRQLKRRRREHQRHADAAPTLALLQGDAPATDYAARRDALRMLDALPSEQRDAVVLHHVVGMSVPELAEALEVPFETARSRLRLGVRKLRSQLVPSEAQAAHPAEAASDSAAQLAAPARSSRHGPHPLPLRKTPSSLDPT